MITVADLLQSLLETTLATSAAVLLVLLLRRRLRHAFGATVAYGAWLLVPVAAVAVLLPAASRPVLMASATQVLVGAPQALAATRAVAAVDAGAWLLLAWLLGMGLAALWFARQQRGFKRGLGTLVRRVDGLQQAQVVEGLPAAIGLWKPAIVLPADFDLRYSDEQRALMLAHERMHIVRGDLHANALTAAMRCVFWFNPLLHAAARHFRHDQELACDLRVIARHPQSRRAYGEAMFKTQLGPQPLPLGCHWGGHPLKERIAMLKQPVPSLSRWIAGASLVGVLVFGVGFAAWSAQPARVVVSRDVPAPPAPPMPPAPPAPPASAPPAPPPAPSIPAVAPVVPAPPPPALPAPAYPKQALAQHINGKVVLLIDVDAQGNATNVVVDKSEPAGVFDQASIDAARKWKFQPAVKDGRPVAGRISVPVQFESRGSPDRTGAKDSSSAPSAPSAQG